MPLVSLTPLKPLKPLMSLMIWGELGELGYLGEIGLIRKTVKATIYPQFKQNILHSSLLGIFFNTREGWVWNFSQIEFEVEMLGS